MVIYFASANFLDANENRSARETTAWTEYEAACKRTNGNCCALLTLDTNYSSLNLPEHRNTALNEHCRELPYMEYSASERGSFVVYFVMQNRLS